MNKDIRKFDNLMLQAFRDCPRFYYFRHVRHISVENPTHPWPLLFGLAIHAALEYYYKGVMNGQTPDEDAVVKKFLEVFPEEQPAPTLKSGRQGEALYTRVRGAFILTEYLPRVPEGVEVVDVEIGAAEMLNDVYAYCGRIDRFEMESGGVRVIDVKTTSRMDRLTTNPSNQFEGYQWLAEKYFEKVAGFMTDVLGIYKNKPIDETFDRQYEKFNQYQVADWRKGVLQIMTQIGVCENAEMWPRNTNHCGAYRGRCQFMPLCTCTSDECVEQLVETMYEHDEWKPYKEVEDDTI